MHLWFVVSLLLASFVHALACDWHSTITATSSTSSFTLNWNEFSCGVVPTRYLVNVAHRGSTLFVSDTRTTTVDILDLNPCTIYHVRICVKGFSCAPAQIVATTCEAPVLLSMNVESPSSSLSSALVRLSWESPEFSEALNYYRVRCTYGCKEGSTSTWSVAEPSVLIPNIDLRKEYIFDVTSISNNSVPGFSTGSISEHKLSTYKPKLVDSLLYRETSSHTRGSAILSPRSRRVTDLTSSDTSSSSSASTGSGSDPESTTTGGSSTTSDVSTTSTGNSTNSDGSSASTTTDDATTTSNSTGNSTATGDLTTGPTTGDVSTGQITTGSDTTGSGSGSSNSTTTGGLTSGTSSTSTGNTTSTLTSGTSTSTTFTTDTTTTGDTTSQPSNATTGSQSTSGEYDMTSTTTSGNPNATTGGDLTSGTSTSLPINTSSSTTTSTTGAATTSTTIPFITLSNVTVYIGVNGNYSSIIPSRFAAAVALSLNVDPSQVTSVTVEQTNSRDAESRTRSLRTRSSSFPAGVGGNVVCTAVISYSTEPPEAAVVQSAFNSTSSVVATYFAKLNATIVTVNFTITSTERPILTTSTTGTNGPKPNVNIAVPVGLVVPSVVLIGAAGGFAFIKYRRNRRAAHRARHWDMHNMYSGLSMSMVDYA